MLIECLFCDKRDNQENFLKHLKKDHKIEEFLLQVFIWVWLALEFEYFRRQMDILWKNNAENVDLPGPNMYEYQTYIQKGI